MSDTAVVSAIEQLKPFLNDRNVLEIVIRGKNERIKAFQKVILSDLQKQEEKALAEKVIHALNKNSAINERAIKLVANVANVQKIGLLFNGLNFCASCVGFAIMYKKLDSMSEQISNQLMQMQNVIEKGNDAHSEYEFNKVLSDHTDMLDCRRKQQPYSEEKMRELVDREYNVLSLLISIFQKDISSDNRALIFSIFSLLSMLTVSLMYFDEIYYENNHNVLGNKDVWHSSHEKWMGAYSTLRSKWFVEKLQDYGMFESNLNILGVDVFYTSLLDQVASEHQEVVDNQDLILALGDIGLLHSLQEVTTQDIKDTIKKAFDDACAEDDKEAVEATYENALKQAGIV